MLAVARQRWFVVLVCLAVIGSVLAASGAAFAADADDSWKIDPQQEVEVEQDGQIKLPQRGLGDVSNLFVAIIRWIFGIVGLFLGVAALFTGAQIAFGGAGGGRREEALQRLWWLILGMAVSFGAWFLVGVLRGLFLNG